MDIDEMDIDDDIGVDLEDIRRACMVSDVDSDNFAAKNNSIEADGSIGGEMVSESEDDFEMLRTIKRQFASSKDADLSGSLPTGLSLPSDSEGEDDFEMIRRIKSQLAFSMDVSLPPIGLSDDDEDDAFETLRAIRRRFSAYENFDPEKKVINDSPMKKTQVHDSGNEPSSFLEAALLFVDAIKKNRAYQKFLRSKLEGIESLIEQNEKHIKNVKIVKGLQAACKRITKLAVSQMEDPRFQLISTRKSVPCESSKACQKKASLMFGPPENPTVADYRMALEKYPVSVKRRKWSTEESKNLAKGLKQEVQKILHSEAIERSSDLDGSTYNIDTINEAIGNFEITPERFRQFLPKINWDSLDIKNRSAAECEARWMSSEDTLINHDSWTKKEDKKLGRIIQEKSLTDWVDIAVSLGTNRTPFQCLVRYQRSLNASILRKEWSAEDDDQLCAAVELFGDKDWQSVANELKGRTGPQCSNRWKKTLLPTGKGRWSIEEDKRLKISVTLFGSQKWDKISQFVPGRAASQCRERWVDCLDPKLNRGKWTEEECKKLREAIAKHGYSRWPEVASHLASRTRRQCRTKWTTLYPHEVPLLRNAKKFRKDGFVGNFVDRESERPASVTATILALPGISPLPEPEP